MPKADFSTIAEDSFTTIDGREFKIKEYFKEKDFIQDDKGGVFVKHGGLLRALKRLFKIVTYNVEVKQVPDKNNEFCATVEAHYVVRTPELEIFHWTSVADCHRLNSMDGFEYYTTTIAETRASARALRNILGVEFCSKEEVAGDITGTSDDDAPIQSNQRALLETKFMNEMKITLEDMSKIVNKQLNTLDDLTRSQAASLIQKLNSNRRKKE